MKRQRNRNLWRNGKPEGERSALMYSPMPYWRGFSFIIALKAKKIKKVTFCLDNHDALHHILIMTQCVI